jgi:hypothetical protein
MAPGDRPCSRHARTPHARTREVPEPEFRWNIMIWLWRADDGLIEAVKWRH